MAIGDYSGQLTLLEVSKLFSEQATNEIKLMEDILQNEIKRHEYMEMRYKEIDEDLSKLDVEDKFGQDMGELPEHEYKSMEELFVTQKTNILVELEIEEEKEIEDEENKEENS